MLALLLLFGHITVMIAAITVAYGGTFLMRVAYMSGQVAPIRGVATAMQRVGPFIGPMFVVAGLFGLLTAIAMQQNLLAPWLVIAYVGFALAMLTGVTENRTWPLKLGAALQSTPDGPVTPEIRELFTNSRTVGVTIFDTVVIVLLIFDMVVKPFS